MTRMLSKAVNRLGDRMLTAVVPTINAQAATCNVQLYPLAANCPFGAQGSDPLYCFFSAQCYRKYSRCSNGKYTLICTGCNCSGCQCL